MPLPEIELAGRFAAVVYDLTSGQPGRFQRIGDCAKRAGIKRPADVTQAVDGGGCWLPGRARRPQLVLLTSKGGEIAHG